MNNKDSIVVEVWIDKILEGYIIEFAIDIVKSYNNELERELFKGPRGRFLLSLQLWIKMLIYKKGILKMNFDE